MASSVNYVATGNIRPKRFVMSDPIVAYGVVEATLTTRPIVGISQMGTRGTPGTAFDTGFAASSGQQINVFQDEDHDECLLELGAAVTGGQLLKTDANALGVPVVLSGGGIQWVGAEARDSGASGATIRVRPKLFFVTT